MSLNKHAQCAMQYCAAEHLVAALTLKGLDEAHWPCIRQICISDHQAEQIANLYPISAELLAKVFSVQSYS